MKFIICAICVICGFKIYRKLMTETFNNWTEYDAWLIQHYEEFAMTKVDEIDGKVVVEYMTKADWEQQERAAGRM